MAVGRLVKGMLVFVSLAMFFSPVTATHAENESGLLGFWTFDEVSGQLLDHSGNGLHGELRGDIERGVPGANNSSAYRFDGAGDWVSIDDPDELSATRDVVSLEIWFNPATVTNEDDMWVYKESNVAMYGYLIQEGVLEFYVDTKEAPGGSWGEIRYTLPAADRWYHVVGTYNGSRMRLYMDGELIGATDQSELVDEKHKDGPAIGATTDATHFFEGSIDEIRLYERVLNTSEVRWHYEDPPGWDPDPGTEGPTNDTSGGAGTNETEDGQGTGNETTDGSADNDTAEDDPGDDGSVFEGSNETDAEYGGGSETSMNGSTDNTSTSSGDEPSMNETTNTTEQDDQTGDDEDYGVTVFPSGIRFQDRPGTEGSRTVRIDNTGDITVEPRMGVIGLSMVSVTDQNRLLQPGESMEQRLLFDLNGTDQGSYTGIFRVETSRATHSVPVRVEVVATESAPRHGGLRVRMMEPYVLQQGSRNITSSIGLENGSVNATVFSTIANDTTTVFRRSYTMGLSSEEVTVSAPSSLPAGEYVWTVTVETPYRSESMRGTVDIELDDPHDEPRAEPRSDAASGIYWIMLAIFVVAGVLYVGWRRGSFEPLYDRLWG